MGNSFLAHNGHSGGGFYDAMTGVGLLVASGGRKEAWALGLSLVAAAWGVASGIGRGLRHVSPSSTMRYQNPHKSGGKGFGGVGFGVSYRHRL